MAVKVKKQRMEKRVFLEAIQTLLQRTTGVKVSLDKADELFKAMYRSLVALIVKEGPFSVTGYGTFYSITSKSGKKYIRYRNLLREESVGVLATGPGEAPVIPPESVSAPVL